MSNHSTNWPHPNEWLPSMMSWADHGSTSAANSFYRKIFPEYGTKIADGDKEYIVKKLMRKLAENGDSWAAGLKRETLLVRDSGLQTEAMAELIKDGYVHETEGMLYVTDKLKEALVQTGHEYVEVRGKPFVYVAPIVPAAPQAPLNTAQTENGTAETAEVITEGAKAAAKSERAWYQFATHSLEDGKAVFSTPRTLVSGAVLLGTGLVAHHYMKASNDDSWQQHTQAQAAGSSEPQR